jgi:hypothetical protein
MADLFDTASSDGEPRDTGPRPLADRPASGAAFGCDRPGRISSDPRAACASCSTRMPFRRWCSGARPAWERPPSPVCSPPKRICISSRSARSSPACRSCERCSRPRAAPPCERAGDAAFRRRDPPLQQGAAGRASCRIWRMGRSCWWAPRPKNPSFELNAALLSRAQVLVLERLSEADLTALLAQRAEVELDRTLPLTPEARTASWRWPMATGARS